MSILWENFSVAVVLWVRSLPVADFCVPKSIGDLPPGRLGSLGDWFCSSELGCAELVPVASGFMAKRTREMLAWRIK